MNTLENKNKKLTLTTAFIDIITHIIAIVDSGISERRVASIMAKIKPQIQNNYHNLFPSDDTKMQKIDDLAS